MPETSNLEEWTVRYHYNIATFQVDHFAEESSFSLEISYSIFTFL